MRVVCRRSALYLSAFVVFQGSTAWAETKVEAAVEQELADDRSARVIIITRPDPDIPSGGASMSAPQLYISDLLGAIEAPVTRLGSLRAVATRITPGQLDRLRSDANVEAVFADIPVPPATDVTVQLIGADRVHGKGFRGTNLAVAILDTGIEASHPAFPSAIVGEACFSTTAGGTHPSTSLCQNRLDVDLTPRAARSCPASVSGCDHGTHVAGIVAGRAVTQSGTKYLGVSPAAQIVPVQVFSLFTDPRDCRGRAPCVLSYPSDQLQALEWVNKNRDTYKIASVNMSLGGGYFDHACDSESPLTETIDRLRSKGVLTVIAAGNDGLHDAVGMPGCISSAITVAASTKAGAIDLSYSNVGPQVDMVAPGTAIHSSVFGGVYGEKSGTSMAAPHVAGAIALLRDEYPSATPAQIETMLLTGAPTLTDARTGRSVAALDLVRSIPAGPGSPVGPASPAGPPTAARGPAIEYSFIISTKTDGQQVASSVTAACAQSCDLKRITETAWKLDVLPSAALLRNRSTLTAADVRKALETLPIDAKVFSNTPAAPLSTPE